jgi:hypothetical protein
MLSDQSKSRTGEPYSATLWGTLAFPGGETSFSMSGHDELVVKRFLTCVCTLLIPDAGVEENLESALEKMQFYREQESFSPPELRALSTTISGPISRVKPRPEFILSSP